MRVIGLMSGTSADGIDVAVVQIRGHGFRRTMRLEAFRTFPYPPAVRRFVLRLANPAPETRVTVGEISQLNFLLGELFAEAVLEACRKLRISLRSVDLIGSHGQTIFHQGSPARFCGFPVRSTLQIAEPSIIAQRTGITTVADFRPRDMAAGGQGAPLVPFVDYLLYRHARLGRVVLNIGGIANLTVIPARAKPEDVFAFDTGPGNMVMDALAESFSRGRLHFDCEGRMAARGKLLPEVLRWALAHPFFRERPPRSAGREQFGRAFAKAFRRRAGRARPEDTMRTAAEFTVASIADAFRRFIRPRVRIDEWIASGGGAHNRFLMSRLAQELKGVRITPSARYGIPEDAKEAFAFAVLAYETHHGRPGNLPGATGASRPLILGKILPTGTRK